MRLAFRILVLAIVMLCLGPQPAGAAGRLGVVLLHDAGGTPQDIAKVAAGLNAAGFATGVPDLCWSQSRAYDKAYPDCLKDVDAAVAALRKGGATSIAIGGVGQGAVFAIDYAAAHADFAGVVALAPSADPPDPSRYPEFAASLKDAAAAAKKRQTAPAPYVSIAPGGPVTITTTPAIFLSFHGPQSPIATIRAIKGKSLPKLKSPLLWVAGTRDPGQASTRAVFAAAPENKLSSYLRVEADHAGTAEAGLEAVVAWLKTLS